MNSTSLYDCSTERKVGTSDLRGRTRGKGDFDTCGFRVQISYERIREKGRDAPGCWNSAWLREKEDEIVDGSGMLLECWDLGIGRVKVTRKWAGNVGSGPWS